MAVDLPVKDEAKWVPETGGESLKKLDADRLAMDVEPSDTLSTLASATVIKAVAIVVKSESPSNGIKAEETKICTQVRETGTRPRKLPVAHGSPTTSVASPPTKTQQTNTSVVRGYAKEFSSSRNIQPPSDKPLQVSVCFAKSPHDFYIQYANFGEMLQKLMISIQTSAVQSDPLVNPIEGMPCLAVFAFDRQWYRAQVLRVMPDGIGIRFVDFGNVQKSPNNADSFRMMEQCLVESPIFAINVKLADVVPLGGNTWSIESKMKFRDLVENHNFTMEHVGMDGGVRLKDSNGTDVIHRLMKENLVSRARVVNFEDPNLNPPPPFAAMMQQPMVIFRIISYSLLFSVILI